MSEYEWSCIILTTFKSDKFIHRATFYTAAGKWCHIRACSRGRSGFFFWCLTEYLALVTSSSPSLSQLIVGLGFPWAEQLSRVLPPSFASTYCGGVVIKVGGAAERKKGKADENHSRAWTCYRAYVAISRRSINKYIVYVLTHKQVFLWDDVRWAITKPNITEGGRRLSSRRCWKHSPTFTGSSPHLSVWAGRQLPPHAVI